MFLITFLAARVVVLLIMTRSMPDLYLFVGQTHVHHLNYGIFLLSITGAYLIFVRPQERALRTAATFYAIGLGLTFDEFGMWVHLGGSYWQRASYDAIVVIGAALGLIAAAPALPRFRSIHWAFGAVLIVFTLIFFALLAKSLNYAGRHLGPKLHEIEQRAPK